MKEFLLIITILMPGDQPDVRHMQPVASIEECLNGAKEWLAKPLSEAMKTRGAIGLASTCAWRDRGGKEDDPT